MALPIGTPPLHVDGVFVESPPQGFWGAYQASVTVSQPHTLTLEPIDWAQDDSLRMAYGRPQLSVGSGVKVAVVDEGIGPHGDLRVAVSRNVLAGSNPADGSDCGSGHGTHVAGIIAGRGVWPGVAPGVDLHSIRVVASAGGSATNYDILFALIEAGRAQCDVVNMSLGEDQSRAPKDETLRRGVEDARDRGCVLIAAAGNSGKRSITRLAEYVSQVGLVVSAVGRRITYPSGSLEETDVEQTLIGTDPNDFVAVFPSYGRDVTVTAPGVGVVSTVPNGGYRPLSGTSMAAPAVSGFVARVIEQNSAGLPATRDSNRVIAILNLVSARARSLGFPQEREGLGLLC